MLNLYSAGIDSFIIARLTKVEHCRYFNLCTKPAEVEMYTIAKSRPSCVIDNSLRFLGHYEMANGYLPLRNLLLIMVASLDDKDIMLNMVLEWAPDKNRGFFASTERLLTQALTSRYHGLASRVQIHIPFSRMPKRELVKLYLASGGDGEELVAHTYSCYSGALVHCGACHGCWKRYLALELAGLNKYQSWAKDPAMFKGGPVSARDLNRWSFPVAIERMKEMLALWQRRTR